MTAHEQKERDVNQIVRHLTAMFNSITQDLPKPARTKSGPNDTYKLQTDFAYLLNEIVMGPKCMIQPNIAACNELLDSIISQKAKTN